MLTNLYAAPPDLIAAAAAKLGAVPADIPDLWWIPERSDVPELTTGQLLELATRSACVP